METTVLLQILAVIAGIVFLLLAKRKMTADIGQLWISFSILILAVRLRIRKSY